MPTSSNTVHGVTGGVEPIEEAIAGVHVEGCMTCPR